MACPNLRNLSDFIQTRTPGQPPYGRANARRKPSPPGPPPPEHGRGIHRFHRGTQRRRRGRGFAVPTGSLVSPKTAVPEGDDGRRRGKSPWGEIIPAQSVCWISPGLRKRGRGERKTGVGGVPRATRPPLPRPTRPGNPSCGRAEQGITGVMSRRDRIVLAVAHENSYLIPVLPRKKELLARMMLNPHHVYQTMDFQGTVDRPNRTAREAGARGVSVPSSNFRMLTGSRPRAGKTGSRGAAGSGGGKAEGEKRKPGARGARKPRSARTLRFSPSSFHLPLFPLWQLCHILPLPPEKLSGTLPETGRVPPEHASPRLIQSFRETGEKQQQCKI